MKPQFMQLVELGYAITFLSECTSDFRLADDITGEKKKIPKTCIEGATRAISRDQNVKVTFYCFNNSPGLMLLNSFSMVSSVVGNIRLRT